MNDILFGLGCESSDDDDPPPPRPNLNNRAVQIVNLLSESDDEDDDCESNNGSNKNGHNNGDDRDDDEESFYDTFWVTENESGKSLNVPPLSKWKEIDLFKPITITVGKAKRNMWVQAMEEIKLIRQNISELQLPLDVASPAAPPMLKVYHTLFGPTSLLSINFCRQLQMTKTEFLHFLFTFYVSCKNQLDVATMHESMEIKSDILMPLKKYTSIWNKIKKQEGNTKQIEFWKVIEQTTNQQLRLLFMSSSDDFPYLLGYDDDKIHFEYSSKTKMDGLGQQHHVKDNRKGLTLHMCAFSATCVPVVVSFQQTGESVQETYSRTMKELFGTGSGGVPNLLGITLASDRGYWEKSLLFGEMLEGGANIIGTVKRVGCCLFYIFFCCVVLFLSSSSSSFVSHLTFFCCCCRRQCDWFPMTYDHPKFKPFPEQPMNITKDGYRDAHHLQVKWKSKLREKKLNAIAFRSGTGTSVALSLSTTGHDLHWDMVPDSNKDMKWYFDLTLSDHDRQMHGFSLLIGESTKEIDEKILSLVAPRSCGSAGQGSKEWFLDRMFSGTSSQIHLLILASAPPLMAANDIDDRTKDEIRTIVKFLNREGILEPPAPAAAPLPSPTTNDGEEQKEEEKEEESEKCEEQKEAESIIDRLTKGNDDKDDDEKFLTELTSFENSSLSWVIHILTRASGDMKLLPTSTCERRLRGWLANSRRHRALIMLSKSDLLTMAEQKQGKKIKSQINKPQIIDIIIGHTNTQEPTNSNNIDNDDNSPLVAILRQSFLRPQQPKSERVAAKIGHRNKEKFLKEFYRHNKSGTLVSPDGHRLSEVQLVYRPGLVAKRGNNFIKDSADGVVCAQNGVSFDNFFVFLRVCTYLFPFSVAG